jgi:ferredoxin-type protein NapF
LNPHSKSNIPFEITKKDCLRLFVRVVCLAVAFVAIWPVFPDSKSLVFIPVLSPFVTIASLIGTRSFQAFIWLGLTVGLLVLIYHRFFCRWICPVGLCVDGAGWLGRKLGGKPMQGPSFGRWIVWLTFGGALLGYPLLLWLDPLAIFSNFPFAVQRSRDPVMWLPATGFGFIIMISIIWPKAWCAKICPLGAFQDILALARRSMQSLIYQKEKAETESIVNFCIDRRTVLGITAGAGLAWMTRTGTVKGLSPLRPPGAADESQFAGICTRCGNCSRVCPSKVIERDFGHNGLANLFTPVLSFKDDYCREDCIRCTEVCPSGAIVRLSLNEKNDIQIGLPHVNMNVCLLGDDRECSACKRWCPYDAIHYVFSQEQYSLIPRIDPLKCNGCGACEAICPTKPQKAIAVLRNQLQS